MDQTFLEHIEAIVRRDDRYRPEAYEFIMEALTHAQKLFSREQHVSGEELLLASRELAVKKFGPLALTVLEHWGVRTTEDLGFIVFNLVDARILKRRDEDTIESFKHKFDLKEAFHHGYRRQLERAVRRTR